MDHTKGIQDIIYQLTRISVNHDKLNRQEGISQLTPINEVFKEGSITETQNTIAVSKVTPSDLQTTIDDLLTEITNESLCKLFQDLPNNEFHFRLNKTIFDHISQKVKEAKLTETWSNKNIWYKPYIAFTNWFDNNRIDPSNIIPLDIESGKRDWTISLYEIAEECRINKERGDFDTYRDAYKYAEDYWTHKGNPITKKQLEDAWYKAVQRGKVSNDDNNP